ncbi:hypothetical protein N7478_003723 [Penicillium angulare]|uniref:uncharacterized protein n=1 Tax=Penicillium angulare TaxID=116970 RepID=UPI0025402EBB|nr:uncharacterized protein N7478_003723 [Penicillium angulare]KAJ5288037.1 hypothetical protein N7478_003723 [Penicillium angulare]
MGCISVSIADFVHSGLSPYEALPIEKDDLEISTTEKLPSTTSGIDVLVGPIEMDCPRPTEPTWTTQVGTPPLSTQAKQELKKYESLFDKVRRKKKKRACSFSGCAPQI